MISCRLPWSTIRAVGEGAPPGDFTLSSAIARSRRARGCAAPSRVKARRTDARSVSVVGWLRPARANASAPGPRCAEAGRDVSSAPSFHSGRGARDLRNALVRQEAPSERIQLAGDLLLPRPRADGARLPVRSKGQPERCMLREVWHLRRQPALDGLSRLGVLTGQSAERALRCEARHLGLG